MSENNTQYGHLTPEVLEALEGIVAMEKKRNIKISIEPGESGSVFLYFKYSNGKYVRLRKSLVFVKKIVGITLNDLANYYNQESAKL